ncbi:hypothetical protein OS493_011111 [Desmophyllum pertusum]|uniref:Uncharacterized protein n=1 Tax=Desmophyllum pertusum TaxID=174260 RepID=A0A9X0CRN2_9CNID|nr:hypothetical protein OS493_011111 [Desmophyllum pertusum]
MRSAVTSPNSTTKRSDAQCCNIAQQYNKEMRSAVTSPNIQQRGAQCCNIAQQYNKEVRSAVTSPNSTTKRCAVL